MKRFFLLIYMLTGLFIISQKAQARAIQKEAAIDTATRMVSFNGQALQNAASFSWKQADETKTLYFELQRSTDSIGFTPVLLMHAKGKNCYTYTDPLFGSGYYYYRLLITSFDGKETYSQVVKVQSKSSDSVKTETVQVKPPFNIYNTVAVTPTHR